MDSVSNAVLRQFLAISIDIKNKDTTTKEKADVVVQVPGAHDQVFLNLQGTALEALITKVNGLALLDNLDKLVQKLLTYFNKSNVEFTIKAAAKKKSVNSGGGSSKKKVEPLSETTTDFSTIGLLIPSSEAEIVESGQL